jgi:hypothetical protein
MSAVRKARYDRLTECYFVNYLHGWNGFVLQDCEVDCNSNNACELHRIYCPDGYACTVNCNQNNACQYTEFVQSESCLFRWGSVLHLQVHACLLGFEYCRCCFWLHLHVELQLQRCVLGRQVRRALGIGVASGIGVGD